MWSREDIISMISSHSEVFQNAFVSRKATETDIKVAEDKLGFLRIFL